jgi:hypothetical protein
MSPPSVLIDRVSALEYQQQLRDLNDLNWERFKAELHSAIAQSEGRLMRWMFIYWSGSVLSLGGLMIALLRK